MPPRRPLRAALAATAVSLFALTGCSSPGAPADPSASSSAASSSAGASVRPAAAPAPSSAASATATVEGDPATVVRVIDGDTVDVRREGESAVTRVRLLNIDTPETKHPSKAVQCLGPEATEHLEDVLEEGDEVTLQYDEDRLDKYGRTLAGVFEGTTLVNAEIARLGLGVPVVFEPNRRFYQEVLDAWNRAEAQGAGLNEPGLECALPVMAEAQPLDRVPPESVGEELALAYAAAVSGDQEWMKTLFGRDLPRVGKLVETYEGAKTSAAQAEREAAERRRQEQAQAEQADAERRAAAERAQAEQDSSDEEEGGAAAGGAPAPSSPRGPAPAAAPAEKEDTPESAGSDGVYYASCAAAKAAGVAPLHRGEAGYRSGMDGDGDGIACEPYKGSGSGSSGSESGSGSSGSGPSSGSGSSGTSEKAPNRCYAPGGGSYVYCDDQSSGGKSSGSGSGGGSGGGSGAGSGSAAGGGPVAGSGGVCPDGYPVKVSGSGKYHLPGGGSYAKTGSKKCFASAAAAEAAGYIAAKG